MIIKYLSCLLKQFQSQSFVSIQWINDTEAIIITTARSYRGSCTVWHDADTGKRAGTLTESWLSDLWTRERWKAEKTIVGTS